MAIERSNHLRDEIWHQVLAGDMEAYAGVVEAFQAPVSAVAYCILGDFSASQDIAQDTFLIAWTRRKELRETEKLGSWLCGIARNLARQARRRFAKQGAAAESRVDLHQIPDPRRTTDPLVSQEEQQVLWEALQQIPEKYRETITLYYRQDQSIEAVAAASGISSDNARQRLTRAREMLRGRVAQMLGGVLKKTAPDSGFASRVIAAIAGISAASKTASVAAASVQAKTAVGAAALGQGTAAAGVAGGIAGGLLGGAGGLLGSWMGTWIPAQLAPTETERQLLLLRGRVAMRAAFLFTAAILAWSTAQVLFRFPPLWFVPGLFLSMAVFAAWLIPFTLRTNRLIAQLREAHSLSPLEKDGSSPESNLRVRTFGNIRLQIQKTSAWRLFGIPLLDIQLGAGPVSGNNGTSACGPARGWIAIGDRAYGILAGIGGLATGLVSFGGMAIGLVSIGGFAVGGLTLGGCAAGFVALGGGAAGYHAAGGCALGAGTAAGGAAIAWDSAWGGLAIARNHAVGGMAIAREANSPAARNAMEQSRFKPLADGMISVASHPLFVPLSVGIPLLCQAILVLLIRKYRQIPSS